jgi:ABC-type multidrug transport system fused ATPase/permease subunit
MDATTEKLILKTLRAEENLTVVMVTHKLSVILSATQILFFERNGNQVKASFKELRKNNLEFSRLIDSLTEIER